MTERKWEERRKMAQFGKGIDEGFGATRAIRIAQTETEENHTVYTIEVTFGHYTWTVKHRYSEFYDLHEKLVSICKIDKTLLPPKKIFGNQNEGFIRKRQIELEIYLQTILYYLCHKLPNVLAAFLEFNQYEIHGITQCMAEELYNKGDALLQSGELYVVSPLQLYALTERLKLPEPTCDSGDVKKDIGHILDFITRVKCIKVKGSSDRVGTSNIDMLQLAFDLTLFKSLECLEFDQCNVSLVSGIETVKETVEVLGAHNSIVNVKDVLLPDQPQWKDEDGKPLVSYWNKLIEADLSHNSITEIDNTVQLMPQVEVLDLSHNQITCIQHLNWLSQLTHLDLSHNAISHLDALNTKLGNVKSLNLEGNDLDSLAGLSKLFSLETLNVSYNKIAQVAEVKHACGLPCMENLHLVGNPVTIVLDYRTKILEMFGDRVLEVTLDGEKPTQKELDTVAVLQAIQKSKDNREKTRKLPSKDSEVDICQSASNQQFTDTSSVDRGSIASTSSGLGWSTHNAQRVITTGSPDSMYSIPDILGELGNRKWSLTPPTSLQFSHSPSDSLTSTHSGSDISNGSQNVMRKPKSRTGSREKAAQVTYITSSSLPGQNNEEFANWLQRRLFGTESDPESVHEKCLRILWCSVVQYSNSNVTIPCAAVLTERRIFLLRLKHGESGYSGVPDMETFYIMPLCNLEQIVVGPCYCYIRLEESFVGPSGTFAMIAENSDAGKSFVDGINSAFEDKELGELDCFNCSQDSDLSRHLFTLEDEEGFCTGRVAFASINTIAGIDQSCMLLLTENKIYLMHIDCLFQPKPKFANRDGASTPSFTILQQHAVMTKMSDIKMSVSVKSSHRRSGSLKTDIPEIKFEQYSLSVVFHELIGPVGLHVKFPSQVSRDTFLDRLTKLRSEHAHRMSPTLREEPEGGNESSSDSPDNSGIEDDGNEESNEAETNVENETPDSNEKQCPSDFSSDTAADLRKSSRSETVIGISVTKAIACSSSYRAIDPVYLTPELKKQLSTCVKNYDLVRPLPSKLAALNLMDGLELSQFFHSDIAMISVDVEQLHYVLWSIVVPYTDPRKEIVTCLMISTRAVYFVSEMALKSPLSAKKSWMRHARHKSDSVIGQQGKNFDKHHSAGIVHSSQKEDTIIRAYHTFEFSELLQVNVGLFDQCVRLTGQDKDSVYTVITRDGTRTEKFLHQLTTMLSIFVSSPMLDKSSSDVEQDFYRAFDKRTKTTVEGMEYTHPSRVQFIYPGEDTVSDLLYVITEHVRLPMSARRKADILMYMLGYVVTKENNMGLVDCMEPRSLILTNEYLCLVSEDVVSYPLPDFVRGLPGTPRYRVTNVRKVEFLKRVILFKDFPRKLTLIFSDESDEIVVDASVEHFSYEDSETGRQSPPEIGITVLIQCQRDMNKFMLLLRNQWKDLQHGDELDVHIL